MKKFLPLLVLVVLLMPVVSVFAATCNEDGANPDLPPCSSVGFITSNDVVGRTTNNKAYGTADIIVSILGIVNWIAWFVGLAAVVMGLYSGFLFITARDDANQLKTARQIMLYAIIGIAVAVISFSLVAISKGIFNFT